MIREKAGSENPASTEELPQSGETLGQYKIEGILAEASSANVFSAINTETDQPVALKLATAETSTTIREEIKLHCKFSGRHPSIVGVDGDGEWKERPFLATKRQEGGTLQDLIAHSEPARNAATERITGAINEIEQTLPIDVHTLIDLETVCEVMADVKREVVPELQRIAHVEEAIEIVVEAAAEHGHIVEKKSLLATVAAQKLLEAAQEAIPTQSIISREETTRRIRIVGDIVGALAMIHAEDFVHRDVKAGNIFINKMRRGMLGDFGSTTGADQKTPVAIGTLGHMAPEAYRGEVSPAGDVFSASVVAYYALVGHLPWTYDEGSPQVSYGNILATTPTPPRARNAYIPEYVEDIMMEGLSLDPNIRPPAQKMHNLLVA